MPMSLAFTGPLLLPSAISLDNIVIAEANLSCASFKFIAARLLGAILSGFTNPVVAVLCSTSSISTLTPVFF